MRSTCRRRSPRFRSFSFHCGDNLRQTARRSYELLPEARLPLREQGVSFVLSSHHNAAFGNLAF